MPDFIQFRIFHNKDQHMKKNLPITGIENHISENANILSTTNLKGAITYINKDFLDVSGFSPEELIGKNHNVVRHPEMPPKAFEQLWNSIQSGLSWMGIVKNRHKNGNHYWVSAYVTPILRDGKIVEYQSVRTRPTAETVKRAERIYSQLLAGHTPRALRMPGISLRWKIIIAGGIGVLAGLAAGFLQGGMTLAAGALVGGISIVLGGGLTYLAYNPLGRVVQHASEISHNPLGQLIYTGRLDEAGKIEFALKMLEAETGGIVGRISDASRQLHEASDDLVSAVEINNQGILQQQNETEQVATAITEMSASIQEVAQNALNTANAADKADQDTRRGHQVVANTSTAISQLASEVEEAASAIHELEERSNDISTVLEVIRGIAEQTNLLALNAAIEAARAGEQGRGFAVVADEVRTLASRTQKSTLEIQEMIEKLQAGARAAVATMQQSREQAESSVEQARLAATALDNITSSVSTITDMSAQIATAVEEQSAVSEEINRNIVSIREVSDANSHTGASSAQIALQGAQLAQSLEELVQQFWAKRHT